MSNLTLSPKGQIVEVSDIGKRYGVTKDVSFVNHTTRRVGLESDQPMPRVGQELSRRQSR